MRELLVLAWTDHYFGPDYLEPVEADDGRGSTVCMSFTTDRATLDRASAVFFHAPSIGDLPPRREDQPWVLMSMESGANYPIQTGPRAQATFDLHMTYRLDSDIPAIYPNWQQYGGFVGPTPRRRGPSPGAPAVYIASNPVAARDAYAAELMRHLRVDSLGRCLNNRPMEEVSDEPDAHRQAMAALRRYKFALAFENSLATDYVTEKLFRPLACGTVPVYLGAPNVRDFTPSDDSVIDASEFASPVELAAYLVELDNDDERYAAHLRWRSVGLPAPFRELVDLGSVDPRIRLARKLAHGCDAGCRCGGRLREPGVLP